MRLRREARIIFKFDADKFREFFMFYRLGGRGNSNEWNVWLEHFRNLRDYKAAIKRSEKRQKRLSRCFIGILVLCTSFGFFVVWSMIERFLL